MALLLTLLFTALLTLMAASALRLGYSDQVFSRSALHETQALYAAESGVERIVHWLRHPESFHVPGHFQNGYAGNPERFFAPRLQGETSFFDPEGRSQFQGVPASPDLVFVLPGDENLLNDPGTGFFRSLGETGKVAVVRVTGPSTAGAICSVESRGISGKMGRTVRVEIGGDPAAPLRGTWWEE